MGVCAEQCRCTTAQCVQIVYPATRHIRYSHVFVCAYKIVMRKANLDLLKNDYHFKSVVQSTMYECVRTQQCRHVCCTTAQCVQIVYPATRHICYGHVFVCIKNSPRHVQYKKSQPESAKGLPF